MYATALPRHQQPTIRHRKLPVSVGAAVVTEDLCIIVWQDSACHVIAGHKRIDLLVLPHQT